MGLYRLPFLQLKQTPDLSYNLVYTSSHILHDANANPCPLAWRYDEKILRLRSSENILSE